MVVRLYDEVLSTLCSFLPKIFYLTLVLMSYPFMSLAITLGRVCQSHQMILKRVNMKDPTSPKDWMSRILWVQEKGQSLHFIMIFQGCHRTYEGLVLSNSRRYFLNVKNTLLFFFEHIFSNWFSFRLFVSVCVCFSGCDFPSTHTEM